MELRKDRGFPSVPGHRASLGVEIVILSPELRVPAAAPVKGERAGKKKAQGSAKNRS